MGPKAAPEAGADDGKDGNPPEIGPEGAQIPVLVAQPEFKAQGGGGDDHKTQNTEIAVVLEGFFAARKAAGDKTADGGDGRQGQGYMSAVAKDRGQGGFTVGLLGEEPDSGQDHG